MGNFPSIPGVNDLKACVAKLKEAMELGLGNRGDKNNEGRYLDKFVTLRDLENYILNSLTIVTALNTSIDPKILNKTINDGVITVTETNTDTYILTVYSEGL